MDDKKKKIERVKKIIKEYGWDPEDGYIGFWILNAVQSSDKALDWFLDNYKENLRYNADVIENGKNLNIFRPQIQEFENQIYQADQSREWKKLTEEYGNDPFQGLDVEPSDLVGKNPDVKTYDKYIDIQYGTSGRPGYQGAQRFVRWTDPVSGRTTKKYLTDLWLEDPEFFEYLEGLASNEFKNEFENAKTTSSENKPTGSSGSVGGGGQKQTTPVRQEIPNPYIDLPTEELEWKLKNATSQEEAQQLVDALRAQRAQKEDEQVVPEVKQRRDLLGHLSDAGRAILGYAGALEDVPHYKMSRPFDDYVRRSQRMSEMGFSQEEKQAFNDAASNAYAYDVKSIKSLAGGSAGTALANLGRAADRLYDSKVDFAARDKAVKNQNLRMFGQAAQSYENVNRQIFQDGLTQAMMNKEAGAALARDAVTNMLNRNQYEKMYGPGSHFDRYQKLLIQRTQAQLDTQKLAQENLIRSMEDQYLGMYEEEDQVDNSLGTVQGTQDLQNFGNATPDDPTGRKATLDQTYASMTKDPETGEIRYKDASTGEDVIILPSEQGGATVTRTNPETGITEKNIRQNTGMSGGTTRTGQVSADDFEEQNRMREQFGLEPYSRYDYIQMRRKEGYFDGGMTKGSYNHKTNPLAVVDKKGNHTGMELTGGEGVFDKPAMKRIEAFARKKDYEKLGMFVVKEMQTWDK